MRLELLKAYPNLLIAHSKYGVSSSIYIYHEGRSCCSGRLYDKIEQLPPYFECALSNFRDILNAHRATLGASMILLEQEKNAPNWVTANKIRLSLYKPIGFTLNCSWNILNAHRASSKGIQNKNDNLNVFGA
jgi:hypothetical protein